MAVSGLPKGVEGFSIEALKSVDGGKFGNEFNRQLNEAIRDIVARPVAADGSPTKPREVKLSLVLEPIVGTEPDTGIKYLKSIKAVGHIDAKRPKSTGSPVDLRIVNSKLCWNPNSQDEFGQLTMDFEEAEAE